MKGLIWDLDGTILDSYGVIVPCTLETLRERGVYPDPAELHRTLIASSVKSFFTVTARSLDMDPEELWERYQTLSEARDGEVRLMDGAEETLRTLSGMGAMNMVFTHKGKSAGQVLERLGIRKYFADILSAIPPIPRKPDPEGINILIRRHGFDRRDIFYIGDRPLDIECAERAGVGSILFLPPSSPARPTGGETYIVSDLREIPGLIK